MVALLLLFKTFTRVRYIWSDTRPDRHFTVSLLDGWATEPGLDRPEAWDNLCLYWKYINSPTVRKPATLLFELSHKLATILLNYYIGRIALGSICVGVSVWLGWSGIRVAG